MASSTLAPHARIVHSQSRPSYSSPSAPLSTCVWPELQARARRVSVVLACSFFGGWVLFPIGFTLGPNFGRSISARGELLTFCFGDLLSKNIYVATMVSRTLTRNAPARVNTPLRNPSPGRLQILLSRCPLGHSRGKRRRRGAPGPFQADRAPPISDHRERDVGWRCTGRPHD